MNFNIDNLKMRIFDIISIYPKSNSKLTAILRLNCDSRNCYITYNSIRDDINNYKNVDKPNIIAEYNDINNRITFDNKESILEQLIQDAKIFKNNIIYDIYKIISQQKNHTIRQCDIKKCIPDISSIISDNDNYIYNFTQLMVASNMLTTYKINNSRFYSIGEQIEYVEPNIILIDNYNSKYEAIVAEYFNEKKIDFKTQFIFPECKNKHCLRFDFCININDIDILVEYNGIQHYKPIKRFGGEENFEKQKINDNIKLNYIKENKIPFIVIPSHIKNKKDIYNFLDVEINKIIN
jgi:hypothetical protein